MYNVRPETCSGTGRRVVTTVFPEITAPSRSDRNAPLQRKGVYHMRTILLLYNKYPPKLYCVVMIDVKCYICVVHTAQLEAHSVCNVVVDKLLGGGGGSFYPECVYYIIRTRRRRRRSIDDTHTLTSVATLRSKGVPVYYIILL